MKREWWHATFWGPQGLSIRHLSFVKCRCLSQKRLQTMTPNNDDEIWCVFCAQQVVKKPQNFRSKWLKSPNCNFQISSVWKNIFSLNTMTDIYRVHMSYSIGTCTIQISHITIIIIYDVPQCCDDRQCKIAFSKQNTFKSFLTTRMDLS